MIKVMKQINSINASGYGSFIPGIDHEFLGVGIYQLSFGIDTFRIFRCGFSILSKGLEKNVYFKNIKKIRSHLNASIFSEASQERKFDILLPLAIEASDDEVVVEVPLLIYSRLLIVLNEMRDL
ncbi:hypothetical protein [Pseudomonas retamae]|uniref:Uncharacterized protein n=1 Tax=Pseudomonas retamae TaxID=702110 RepID=A0ABW7DCZ4_9PSED